MSWTNLELFGIDHHDRVVVSRYFAQHIPGDGIISLSDPEVLLQTAPLGDRVTLEDAYVSRETLQGNLTDGVLIEVLVAEFFAGGELQRTASTPRLYQFDSLGNAVRIGRGEAESDWAARPDGLAGEAVLSPAMSSDGSQMRLAEDIFLREDEEATIISTERAPASTMDTGVVP